MNLYPLKFDPIYEYRVWGGENLKNVLRKNYSENNIGESWEISAVEGKETVVSNGALKDKTINELIEEFKKDFIGSSFQDTNYEFPLLIKFIDSATPLSIQVHPDDVLARKRHNSLGKNEMWYVMPSDKDASITVGFKEEINQKDYENHIKENTITSVLNEVPVKEGDAFYIPNGRVHAIGAGVTLAEIQQSSNITYRIYDYDRIDRSTGKKRALHTDLALEAIDFSISDQYNTVYNKKKNVSNTLINSPFFRTNFLTIDKELTRDLTEINSFIIYMCVKGNSNLTHLNNEYSLNMGECILIPACINEVAITSNNADLIEIFI